MYLKSGHNKPILNKQGVSLVPRARLSIHTAQALVTACAEAHEAAGIHCNP